MWRTQSEPMLIDLGSDFFIMKLTSMEEFTRALIEGPWMIEDNYHHVQRWQPNFVAEEMKISMPPVWIRIPQLPVEYYKMDWLKKTSNNIGRTIKVDTTTLAMSRGKFARVCIEIDLNKSLRSYFRMHRKAWRIQYEGLHDLFFTCGKYGHKEGNFPTQTTKKSQDEKS